jgi:hypothetical protein
VFAAGNDSIYAGDGAGTVYAGEATTSSSAARATTCSGRGGNDTLTATGNDLLAGGASTDNCWAARRRQLPGQWGRKTPSRPWAATASRWGLTLDAVSFSRQATTCWSQNATDRLPVTDWFAADSHFAS